MLRVEAEQVRPWQRRTGKKPLSVTKPCIDETLTIAPSPAACIPGTTYFAVSHAARRSTAMKRSHSSMVIVVDVEVGVDAGVVDEHRDVAELGASAGRQPRRPAARRRCRTRGSAPVGRSRSAICSPTSVSMSRNATRAHHRARRSTVARPMPRAPPVTKRHTSVEALAHATDRFHSMIAATDVW